MKSIQETLDIVKQKINQMPDGIQKIQAELAYNQALRQGDNWYFISTNFNWKMSARENTIEQAKESYNKFVKDYYKKNYPDFSDKTLNDMFIKHHNFDFDVCYQRETSYSIKPPMIGNQVNLTYVNDNTQTFIKAHNDGCVFSYKHTKEDSNQTLKFFEDKYGRIEEKRCPGQFYTEDFFHMTTTDNVYSVSNSSVSMNKDEFFDTRTFTTTETAVIQNNKIIQSTRNEIIEDDYKKSTITTHTQNGEKTITTNQENKLPEKSKTENNFVKKEDDFTM